MPSSLVVTLLSPAPPQKGSAYPNIRVLGARVRFRATPFTSSYLLLFLSPCGFSHFTTGRLTSPYPERLHACGVFLFDRQPLPGCPAVPPTEPTSPQFQLFSISAFLSPPLKPSLPTTLPRIHSTEEYQYHHPSSAAYYPSKPGSIFSVDALP